MIQFHAVEWDDPANPQGNVWHIGEHGLTPDEVEDVLYGRNGTDDISRSTGRHLRFGWTSTGRHIVVAYQIKQGRTLTVSAPSRPTTSIHIEGRPQIMAHRARRPAGLTPEQRSEFGSMRASDSTPEAMAREAVDRAAIMAEVPPARPGPGLIATLAHLRDERRRRKLSLEALSTQAGMTRIALSRIERGQGNPTLATVSRVAEALGLEAQLVFVTPNPPPDKSELTRMALN